jgi:primosomal protein N' (replication factor Y)
LGNVRAVDVCIAIRSSRFDLPLTYDAHELEVHVGDVVRVPLGSRDVLAFVISTAQEAPQERALRPIAQRLDVPRAFDETGLALARFVAGYFMCTLAEALSVVTLSDALPRSVDSLIRTIDVPDRERYPSVPARLLQLMWNDFEPAFALQQLLRHPEARRCGDRAALLRYVTRLVQSGALRRERRFIAPKVNPYVVKALFLGQAPLRGRRAEALLRLVGEQPGIPRADALLAGFSSAVIARAIRSGAIEEREMLPASAARSELSPVEFSPTREQARALEKLGAWIEERRHRRVLLHGVTGSGKTYVYVEAIKQVVRSGGRAIVLVPEISLTPQTARRFEAALGNRVAVLHSALSDRERFDAWQACMRGSIDVVVGARSAVFAPLSDVRLIVVDESHEGSYKQDTVPRYHAVTVARERMRAANGVLLLGSATPSLESFHAARQGRIERLSLEQRPNARPLPRVTVVDLAKEFESGNKRIFSTVLTRALSDRLERREKSVLFINRRGSGAFVLCRSCGFVPRCARCDVSLAAHRSERIIRCHYCDATEDLPQCCPSCGKESIREFGTGTEHVAQEVLRLFPGAKVVRMDSDTTTRVGDHARILREFETEADVLVGTQMVAKGLDFPTVTLAAAVAADVDLHNCDFRAAERGFGLIAQLCGRSGRAQTEGMAIVQTYMPSHRAIACVQAHDYEAFALWQLEERAEAGYPPFVRLMYVGVIGRSRQQTLERAALYAQVLAESRVGEVLGPAPYPLARIKNEWRMRIVVKTYTMSAARAAVRERILPLARSDRTTRVAINVDP